jgi:hypothetical protein
VVEEFPEIFENDADDGQLGIHDEDGDEEARREGGKKARRVQIEECN